jgi:hypothetical protein
MAQWSLTDLGGWAETSVIAELAEPGTASGPASDDAVMSRGRRVQPYLAACGFDEDVLRELVRDMLREGGGQMGSHSRSIRKLVRANRANWRRKEE